MKSDKDVAEIKKGDIFDTLCTKKNGETCFCQNFVKFPPTLLIKLRKTSQK